MGPEVPKELASWVTSYSCSSSLLGAWKVSDFLKNGLPCRQLPKFCRRRMLDQVVDRRGHQPRRLPPETYSRSSHPHPTLPKASHAS